MAKSFHSVFSAEWNTLQIALISKKKVMCQITSRKQFGQLHRGLSNPWSSPLGLPRSSPWLTLTLYQGQKKASLDKSSSFVLLAHLTCSSQNCQMYPPPPQLSFLILLLRVPEVWLFLQEHLWCLDCVNLPPFLSFLLCLMSGPPSLSSGSSFHPVPSSSSVNTGDLLFCLFLCSVEHWIHFCGLSC